MGSSITQAVLAHIMSLWFLSWLLNETFQIGTSRLIDFFHHFQLFLNLKIVQNVLKDLNTHDQSPTSKGRTQIAQNCDHDFAGFCTNFARGRQCELTLHDLTSRNRAVRKRIHKDPKVPNWPGGHALHLSESSGHAPRLVRGRLSELMPHLSADRRATF
jgi:hypothetical protein